MKSIKGKNVIITGAGSGMGKAAAYMFAEAGANVVAAGRTLSKVQTVADEINKRDGGRAIAVQADVSNERDVNDMVGKAVSEFGGVDVLITSAAVCPVSPVTEISLNDWNETMRINVNGVFLTNKAVIPYMKKQGAGRIINIASNYGKMGVANYSNYNASKAAVITFTRCLAMELCRENIRVNSICPGNTDTEMLRGEAAQLAAETGRTQQDVIDEWGNDVPIGRNAYPEEIADLCLFLASDRSNFITGEDINISGGICMF